MKFFIVLFALAAIASAEEYASIIRSEKSLNPDAGYAYGYETSDGIKIDEAGVRKTVGEEQVFDVRGQFEYVGTDGKTYSVSYTADENGFHPQGAHLP